MSDIVNKIEQLIGTNEGCGKKKKKMVSESAKIGDEVFKMLVDVVQKDRKKFTSILHDYIDPMSKVIISDQVDKLNPKKQKELMDELMDLEYKD